MQESHIPVLVPLDGSYQPHNETIKVVGSFACSPSSSEPSLYLALTDKYLLCFQDPQLLVPSRFAVLNFDLKFQILRETPWKDDFTPGKPVGIRLQKQLAEKTFQVLELYSADLNLLIRWKQELEGKLNQRNFHTLFKAKKQIGKGAFATVYLAERLEDKKLVAVKAFSKQRQYMGEQGKQSLINQITLMRKFNHDNIMRIYGVYETDNSIYVILEMLEGRQLYERLKNNELKEQKDIEQIIRNILKALKAMSEKRVIHRDLKPENIMFRKEGSNDLAICDFGLATYADEEKYLFVRCGTPGFVAPQIINIRDMSTKSDPISDVFSAGLIFHYLLFGKSIFQGKKYQEILTQNRACNFNFQKEIYKSANPYAMDLLKKLLEVNQRMRISAQEALKHPYFDENKQQVVNYYASTQNSAMVDEKQEDVSTVAGKSNKKSTRPFQNHASTSIPNSKKNSIRGSLHYEKQNEVSQNPVMSKKSSVMSDAETLPVRRSKRNSIHEKKPLPHQMRT